MDKNDALFGNLIISKMLSDELINVNELNNHYTRLCEGGSWLGN